MYLLTDKQTLADLDIRNDSSYGGWELCSLFGKTHTKEGKRMVREWISQPLSDYTLIQERIEAIRSESIPVLDMDEEELDFIEYYLACKADIVKADWAYSLATEVVRKFKHSPQRYVVERGVKLVVRLLDTLRLFADEIKADAPLLLKRFAETIRGSIDSTELKDVLKQSTFPYYTIDSYDYLFRYTRLRTIKEELLSIVYQLDVLRTAHEVALKRGFSYPCLTQGNTFCVEGFFHPYVKEPVRNNWKLEEAHICIFTGSNMAGKSTTLKAISLCVWLAHCGLPVPALRFQCPVYEGIYTSINLPDSLRDGRSHFMSEVLRIKEIISGIELGKRYFVVLDEMFRGTNARDAYEASVAVNTLLQKYKKSTFLISTHIVDFATHFQKDGDCSFYYMESDICEDELVCSHCLKPGISESRVGYWIVKKELFETIDIKGKEFETKK